MNQETLNRAVELLDLRNSLHTTFLSEMEIRASAGLYHLERHTLLIKKIQTLSEGVCGQKVMLPLSIDCLQRIHDILVNERVKQLAEIERAINDL